MNLNISTIFSIKNLTKIIFGSLILALATSLFVVPFNLIYGGVTGIALSFSHIFKLGQNGTDVLIFVLTWSLFIIGYFTLGKEFALKTFITSFLYPVFVSLFSRLVSDGFLNGFFNLKTSSYGDISLILASVFGGSLTGVGCALTFSAGGSTGGADVLGFLLCKKFHLKSSVSIFMVDAFIILLGVVALGDFALSLIGIVTAFVCAIAIDKLFLPHPKAFVAQIISENCEKINADIIKILNRTTTIMDITGGYSGRKMKMLFFSFTIREYATVNTLIENIDKNAFVAIFKAHEINGEGWRKDNNIV